MPFKNIELQRKYFKEWRKSNPDKMKIYMSRHYLSHKKEKSEYQRNQILLDPVKWKEMQRKSYLKNIEKRKKCARAWRLNHPELCRKYSKEYRLRNLAKNAAQVNAREALKIMAMPKWVDRGQILKFYTEARRKTLIEGIPYHVDHIWPLRGKGFTGLHVPWNLQVIPAIENIRKQNKRPLT